MLNKSSFFIVGKHAVVEALKNPKRKVLKVFLTEESKKTIHRISPNKNLLKDHKVFFKTKRELDKYCGKDQINGTRITRQGNQYFVDEYEKRTDPSHKNYYWIKGEIIDDDSSIDYDGKAISENYISITPIHFKLTNEQYLKELKPHFADE